MMFDILTKIFQGFGAILASTVLGAIGGIVPVILLDRFVPKRSSDDRMASGVAFVVFGQIGAVVGAIIGVCYAVQLFFK